MLRMEIALFLVMGFIACVYFSAGRKGTPLHRTFSALLVVVLIHLGLDGVTVYTVHHLEAVPRLLNDAVHRLFLGSTGKSRTQRIVIYYRFVGYVEIPEVSQRPRIKADTRKGVAVEYLTEPLPV